MTPGDLGSRHRHHHEIYPIGDFADGAVCRHFCDCRGAWVDSNQPTGETSLAEILQHLSPDPTSLASCTDHSHHARSEYCLKGVRFRSAFACVGGFRRAVGCGRTHLQVHRAVGTRPVQCEPRISKDGEHGSVAGEHLSHESFDSIVALDCREMFEQ